MTIREAFGKLAVATAKGMKNPFFVIKNLHKEFKDIQDNVTSCGTPEDAKDIDYDNTTSGLTGTNVQSAIDEVAGAVDDVSTEVSVIDGRVDTLEGSLTPINVSNLFTLGTDASVIDVVAYKTGKIVSASIVIKPDTLTTLKDAILIDLNETVRPVTRIHAPATIIVDFTAASSVTYTHEIVIENSVRFANEGGFNPIGSVTSNTLIVVNATWVTS